MNKSKRRYFKDGTIVWQDEDGQPHRDDGPAVVDADGTQAWYKHGRLHRDDGPAVVQSDGVKVWFEEGWFIHDPNFENMSKNMNERQYSEDGTDGSITIMGRDKHGWLHRDDGPAVVQPNGIEVWYKHGWLHRDDGPAVVQPNGIEVWYKHGRLHRDDGPAVVQPNGIEVWFEEGRFIRFEKIMAIRSITIENFKCIGDAVTIPIRPITLLFGKNSSGKSTVLQALSYMLNVNKTGGPEPRSLVGMDTDFMNLGSFYSFVHLHELNRKIVVHIEFRVKKGKVKGDDQLGWAKIETGWDKKRNHAYVASRTIGIGDAKWEYNDAPKPLTTSFMEELEGIRFLGPIRKTPSRDLRELHHVLGLSDDKFKIRNGYWNELQAWEILLRDGLGKHSQLIEKINSQMKYLKLGYEISAKENYVTEIHTDELEDKLRGLCVHTSKNGDSQAQNQISELIKQLQLPRKRTFELDLYDKKNKIHLDFLDVGTGISQVIPVLVGVLEDSYRLFVVAQPELHVHPAAQVALGDVFIDAIKNSDRTMLIETHSEHLLLRLLRRVRETNIRKSKEYEWQQSDMIPLHREMSEAIISDAESQGSKDHSLTPDKLSIVYVESTSEGVEFIPLNVMDDGDFDGPWPEGFFDERVKEIL